MVVCDSHQILLRICGFFKVLWSWIMRWMRVFEIVKKGFFASKKPLVLKRDCSGLICHANLDRLSKRNMGFQFHFHLALCIISLIVFFSSEPLSFLRFFSSTERRKLISHSGASIFARSCLFEVFYTTIN